MGPWPMPRGLTTLLFIFSTRDLVLILVSIDGFRPLKVTHLLTPRMGVAAGRARAQAETLQTGGAPAARVGALPSASSLTITTSRVTTAIAPRTVRDYLFLIEWQSTNQPTNPPTKRATSEASEPTKQATSSDTVKASEGSPLRPRRPSVSPSSVVDLLRLDLTDFEFEKSNRCPKTRLVLSSTGVRSLPPPRGPRLPLPPLHPFLNFAFERDW